MKYAIEFRDPRVQAMAEALFTSDQLRFLMVSKAMPIGPMSAEQRATCDALLADVEADLKRARLLLALTDTAVALNGGNYERIFKYADNAEDNQSLEPRR